MRKLIITLIITVGFLSSVAKAAGPAMHVALGKEWLALYAPQYTEQEKKLFLLGTVFPDIRYLGVIKRDQSHYKNMTLKKVLEEKKPFMRGIYFHSYVDEHREKYVHEHAPYKKLSDISPSLRGTFLKLIEDEIIHQNQDWTDFRIFLSTIPDEEKILGISNEALTQWHTGLSVYFSTYPSFILAQLSMFDKGILSFDAQTIKTWNVSLPQHVADPDMQKYVRELMSSFDKTMKAQHG